MKRRSPSMVRHHLRLFMCISVMAYYGQAWAQIPSPDDLHKRQVHRRAVEAVIWSMPLVNFDRMLQAAIRNGGAPNQIIYWSQPVNWQNQTLTPNPDTIYLNPFYDTRKGPVVLEIPAADGGAVVVGSVDTAWQNALEDIGPAGVDKGKGGKYLILPPGFKGNAPEGYIVLPSDTYQGFVILRSNFKSRNAADIAAAVSHGKLIKFYPLGEDPGSTVFVDMYDKPFDATIPYDIRYFESLHRMITVEPWLTRDKVMIEMLRTLGIAKETPFAPDEETRNILTDAAREAQAEIALNYEAGFAHPFFEGTGWAVPISKEAMDGMSSGFAEPNSYAIDGRATIYHMAYFSAKHLGAGQFYLLNLRDREGLPLEGGKTYRLTVPPNAPVNQYWSVTAYDRKTHALIREMARASLASVSSEIKKNPDGTTDVYFGPKAPEGKEGNWVPTDPKGEFELLFRVYGPEKAFFKKEWKLPDVEALK